MACFPNIGICHYEIAWFLSSYCDVTSDIFGFFRKKNIILILQGLKPRLSCGIRLSESIAWRLAKFKKYGISLNDGCTHRRKLLPRDDKERKEKDLRQTRTFSFALPYFWFKIVALKLFVQSIVKSLNESSSSGGSGTALNSENSVSDWVKSKMHALNDNHMSYDLLKGL